MPNSPNATKALRQTHKRRALNRTQRSSLRTVIKNVRAAAESGDAAAAQSALNIANKRLDQAAAKNLIHSNAASRTKSRLAKLVKAKAPNK